MRKRKLVDEVRGDWNVSIRRACRVLLLDTSSYHYKSRRPGQAVLEQRIKEICQTRVRYGYRRVHVLLCREGWRINHKKTYRVYREMGLLRLAAQGRRPAGDRAADAGRLRWPRLPHGRRRLAGLVVVPASRGCKSCGQM